ncbi:MAG TPA: RNA-binding cell elongation regulator Jag/EloR [Acidimicrobiales bacterium]|jgi:spoIIIJ-associated protein|nr:RNA-binding cell elongation regulator Jag/EloR [Acidimicrobiales bacterium]
MEWVEVSARTLEEAKEKALDHLGVDEQDAEFEVVAEPRTGLFGWVRAEARVRARVRPVAPLPKESNRDRRKRTRRQSASAGGSGPSGEGQTGRAGSGRRRRSRRRGQPPAGVAQPAASQPAEAPQGGVESNGASRGEGGTRMDQPLPLEEQAALARSFLEGLLDRMQLEASVTATESPDDQSVHVAVDGEGLGILIGPRGATLASLQELARTVVQRRSAGHACRINVDVSGYWEKRRQALERFSRQVAEEVRASGQEQALEPMSPTDRKIVHDTINEIPGVTTRSDGEEPRRYVVIVPEHPGR